MDKEEMKKEGWKLSTISSGAHLRRWTEVYEEMDYEVYLDKIDVATENKDEAGCGTECTICYQNEAEPPYRVYVKSRNPVSDQVTRKSNDNS